MAFELFAAAGVIFKSNKYTQFRLCNYVDPAVFVVEVWLAWNSFMFVVILGSD